MITLKISFCFFGINKDTHINIFLINWFIVFYNEINNQIYFVLKV